MLQQALHCHVFSVAQYFILCSLVIKWFLVGSQIFIFIKDKGSPLNEFSFTGFLLNEINMCGLFYVLQNSYLQVG